ncbi:MAG: hypothetical protein WDO69_18420 [Pseudomonadota bacterium]
MQDRPARTGPAHDVFRLSTASVAVNPRRIPKTAAATQDREPEALSPEAWALIDMPAHALLVGPGDGMTCQW